MSTRRSFLKFFALGLPAAAAMPRLTRLVAKRPPQTAATTSATITAITITPCATNYTSAPTITLISPPPRAVGYAPESARD